MVDKKDRIEDEKRVKVKIDKDKEARTEEISDMIGEGGLGAEKYYEIKKISSDEVESGREIDK